MMKYATISEKTIPAIVSQRAYLSSNRVAPWRYRSVRRPMLICSSTSWLACQKKRYGEIVVPVMLARLLDLGDQALADHDLDHLKIIFAGGSRLGGELCRRAMSAFGPI